MPEAKKTVAVSLYGEGENIFVKIIYTILDIIETVKHEIYVIFD